MSTAPSLADLIAIRDREQFLAEVQRRRQQRMDKVDAMSPELRALVHDYGLPVVQTCLDLGVTKPRHIKHLVNTILDSFSPTRGSYSIQGVRAQFKEDEPQ